MLFIVYSPLDDVRLQRFVELSRCCRGDVIAPAGQGDEVTSSFHRIGSLGFHTWASTPGRWRAAFNIMRSVRCARRLARNEQYDVVVACGLFWTTIAGWLIAQLGGSRWLCEVPVLPREIVRHRDPTRSWRKSFKGWWLGKCAGWLLARTDHCKWIFPGQASAISPTLASHHGSVFPDFVAVDAIASGAEEDAIVLLGTPLYLKGADLAIRAFQIVQKHLDAERLQLIGSAQGFALLRMQLRHGDAIELIDYLPHPQAIEALRRAKIVLIPSRTDAMPRVAVEAMAAGKPIVASRVDGMASYLHDERNALLATSEDADALAAQLERLLGDPALRKRLGAQARLDALAHFGAAGYTKRYRRMLDDCLADRPGQVFNYT